MSYSHDIQHVWQNSLRSSRLWNWSEFWSQSSANKLRLHTTDADDHVHFSFTLTFFVSDPSAFSCPSSIYSFHQGRGLGSPLSRTSGLQWTAFVAEIRLGLDTTDLLFFFIQQYIQRFIHSNSEEAHSMTHNFTTHKLHQTYCTKQRFHSLFY